MKSPIVLVSFHQLLWMMFQQIMVNLSVIHWSIQRRAWTFDSTNTNKQLFNRTQTINKFRSTFNQNVKRDAEVIYKKFMKKSQLKTADTNYLRLSPTLCHETLRISTASPVSNIHWQQSRKNNTIFDLSFYNLYQRVLVLATTSQRKPPKEKKRETNSESRLLNNQLSNYPEEERFRMQQRHSLKQWTISLVVSNHCLGGGWRGSQCAGLTLLIRDSPLGEVFMFSSSPTEQLDPSSNNHCVAEQRTMRYGV